MYRCKMTTVSERVIGTIGEALSIKYVLQFVEFRNIETLYHGARITTTCHENDIKRF